MSLVASLSSLVSAPPRLRLMSDDINVFGDNPGKAELTSRPHIEW